MADLRQLSPGPTDYVHCARVYLAQARHFRLRDGWAGHTWVLTLLTWAANARRRAAAQPRQGALL